MARLGVPRGWKQITKYAEDVGESEPFKRHVAAFADTNSKTLRRVCMADAPPYLPGIFQSYDYTMGIFSKNSRGELMDSQQAVLRQGLWSTYLKEGGSVEALIHPNALTYRLGCLTAGAMRESLLHAWQVAQHPNVELRIRKPDTPFGEQAGTWALKYPNGLGTSPVQPSVTTGGIESVLHIEEADAPEMEKTWDIVYRNSRDAETSLRILGDAIDMLPEE